MPSVKAPSFRLRHCRQTQTIPKIHKHKNHPLSKSTVIRPTKSSSTTIRPPETQLNKMNGFNLFNLGLERRFSKLKNWVGFGREWRHQWFGGCCGWWVLSLVSQVRLGREFERGSEELRRRGR
ncbi:hypothetical protein ACJW31_11G124700 [Castanea mollissima]